MTEVKVLKYLGDHLSVNLEESVYQTVIKRVVIAKHAIFEIRSVIEDTRANIFGSVNVAFMIWETAIIPMLTFNSESWFGMNKKTLKILDDLFHTFCRAIFRVSTGCPIPSFYWESGSLKFSNIILQRQLNFIHHLANLEEGSVARSIFEEEVQNSRPGLYQTCQEHLSSMGISDLKSIPKPYFKKVVKKYIFARNQKQLLDEIRKYKKLSYDQLSQETFERKPYFFNQSLENARMCFRVATKLVPTILANFPSKYRRRGQSLTCPSCSTPVSSELEVGEQQMEPLHSQSHILTECEAVRDIRDECEPQDDFSLAQFFKKVVARNMEIEDLLT